MTTNLETIHQEFKYYSELGVTCRHLAEAHVTAWRRWHVIQGHNAYKRGTRAYCGTCEREFVFTEEQAYQTITGQTAEEAATFFKQRTTIAAKWREANP